MERMRKRPHLTDWVLLGACAAMAGFGCLMQASCWAAGFAGPGAVATQLCAAALGVPAALLLARADPRAVAGWWPVLAGCGAVLCLLLLTPLGYTPPGSDDRAWLRVFGLSFQPSEFLKLVFVLTVSLHLSRVRDRLHTLRQFLLLGLHGGAYVGAVMLQGDYGSATVFLAAFGIMLFAAGLSWKLLAAGGGVLLGAVPLAWIFLLPDYLKERFFVAWHPETDPLGRGYQQYRGLLALGSGQWTGRGLFAGGLVSVPEAHNDFIFAHIGQTLGFLGCGAVAAGMLLICGRILWIARRCRDPLGRSICCGVFAILFYQSLINIGMVLCVIPVIGITLPFISGGGTSLLISFLGIGLVLAVARQERLGKIFRGAD